MTVLIGLLAHKIYLHCIWLARFISPLFCSRVRNLRTLGSSIQRAVSWDPLGRHRIAIHIEIDRIVPNRKDACQFMGDDDDRGSEAYSAVQTQVHPATWR